ncbi:hypothetical protein LSAT2_028227 [Lamellibrachia satsuma]|nr:hypothetical protein LSAT2_028227 [Lamellibrachia satsuma]
MVALAALEPQEILEPLDIQDVMEQLGPLDIQVELEQQVVMDPLDLTVVLEAQAPLDTQECLDALEELEPLDILESMGTQEHKDQVDALEPLEPLDTLDVMEEVEQLEGLELQAKMEEMEQLEGLELLEGPELLEMLTGPRGIKGDSGATGQKGEKGDRGPAGPGLSADAGSLQDLCSNMNCDEICEVTSVHTAPNIRAFCICTLGYTKVRVNEGVKCSSLSGCNYNNGGCEHSCSSTDGIIQCGCNPGYELAPNMRSCFYSGGGGAVYNGGAGGAGGNATNDTVDCNIRNGGCEHVCVRGENGGFDYCSCFTSGYYLSLNERDCIDVDECIKNTTCEADAICINTIGRHHCVSFNFGVTQNDGDSPSLSNQTQQLALSNKAAGGEGAVASFSSLQVSMVALIAWVVVMTLALVTLSIVMYRRWRHTPTFDNQSVSGASESPSDLSSEFETENTVTAENETGARNNHGFSSDDAAVAEPCQVHATVTQL